MTQTRRGHLRQSTYDSVKSLIITGQLAPGARVTEAELTERLGVSRTPVREALNRLERDGLVVGREKNGFAVVAFDADTAREAFELREVLEAHSTALACEHASAQDHKELLAMIAECEQLAAVPDRSVRHKLQEFQVGVDIHRAIAQMSGNAMLAKILGDVLDRCQIYVWMDLTVLDDWDTARDEHRELVKAICARDTDRAVSIIRRHVAEAGRNVMDLMRARADLRDYFDKPMVL